jgi:hypothetical protein
MKNIMQTRTIEFCSCFNNLSKDTQHLNETLESNIKKTHGLTVYSQNKPLKICEPHSEKTGLNSCALSVLPDKPEPTAHSYLGGHFRHMH